jgi:hypothetical protein
MFDEIIQLKYTTRISSTDFQFQFIDLFISFYRHWTVSIIRVHWRNIFQNILPRCIAVASEFWSYASCKNSSRSTCYTLRHFSNDRNNNALERAYKQSWNSLYFFRNDGHVSSMYSNYWNRPMSIKWNKQVNKLKLKVSWRIIYKLHKQIRYQVDPAPSRFELSCSVPSRFGHTLNWFDTIHPCQNIHRNALGGSNLKFPEYP